jgi:hypothetical protein
LFVYICRNNNKAEEGRYFAGLIDLFFNEKPTSIKGRDLMFDCGTARSYFNSIDYKVLLDLVSKNHINYYISISSTYLFTITFSVHSGY